MPTIIQGIQQEVQQGVSGDRQYRKVKDIILYFAVLELPQVSAAIGVAENYTDPSEKMELRL